MITRCLILCLLLSLSGCQPGDDGLALQADYLKRVNTALEGNGVAAFDATQLPNYRMPARRLRLIEIPDIRISLLDLLIDVRRCPDLQLLISERNSILGKQMLASSRLGYEGDLLRAIDACRAYLSHQPEQTLNQTLAVLATQKRQQLRAVYWNALNTSPEFEHTLRFSQQALPVSHPEREIAEHNAPAQALQQLVEIGSQLPTTLPPASEKIDPLLFTLQASEQGPELITSLLSLTDTLNQASDLLETRQRQRPLCPIGKPTERARIVQNIFVKFYAAGLQPYLATVDQQGRVWRASLRQLSRVEQIPVALYNYLQALAGPEDSVWQRFVQANGRHVKAWQQILKPCSMAPGQSSWSSSS